MKKILLITLLLPLLSSCCFICFGGKVQQSSIKVENQLPVNVFCFPKREYPAGWNYDNKKYVLGSTDTYLIKAGKTQQLFFNHYYSESYWLLTDTLQILVVEENVYRNNTWDYIDSNNLILRKLNYTPNDIVNNSGRIIIK